MPNVSEQISQILLKKLREEELSAEEAAILAEWEGRSPEHAEFIAMLMDEAALSDKIKNMLELDERAAWQRIEKALAAEWNDRAVAPVRKTNWYKYAVAASVILFAGIVGFFLLSKKETVSEASKATKPATVADIAPGGNRAELTLADGSVIDLGKAKNGELADEAGSKVMKTEDGKLVYEREGGSGVAAVTYNILRTPRGGQYQLDLPDGSRVWLNAASSLTYPVVFSSTERKVEITGEAFFEVARDENKKFLVVVKNGRGQPAGEITVLGTQFNVQAYDEEKIVAASLVEGKIKMSAGQMQGNATASTELSPGQQAQITANNTLKVIDKVDMDHVTAWKTGMISFESTDVRTIMRSISRWYNVDVTFEGDVENRSGITGSTPRNTSLADVIKVLRLNDINVVFENGKLVVRPGKPSVNPTP
jgi:transmembrane sensor